MYHTIQVIIDRKHPMFNYFDNVTRLANNLYNATLFRMRQVKSGLFKEPDKRQQNEIDVLTEIENALMFMTGNPVMPTKETWFLSKKFLCALFLATQNVDYTAIGLPRQTAQGVVKQVVKDMKSYTKARKEYFKHPEKFLGEPKMPHYKDKGGHCKAPFTNQDCVLHEAASSPEDFDGSNEEELQKNGKRGSYIKFPLTKLTLKVGDVHGKLKEVSCIPYYGKYCVCVVIDDGIKKEKPPRLRRRIIAIDLGVDNFAAITNNIGLPCLLFKGGVIKSANQWYNKRFAEIVSEQTKETQKKFKPTPESIALTRKRDCKIGDFMHKVAKNIITWCVDNQIDTIVIGENKLWKQNINIGHVNNQEFVQIPFSRFKKMMEYLCEYNRIKLVLQEESYTSKASFLGKDPIPVYEEGKKPDVVFSGKRRPTTYNGSYKKGGFRGLYQCNDGKIINADLNGSANIGRKAFPRMFTKWGCAPNFDAVEIKTHPDLDFFNPLTVKKTKKQVIAEEERVPSKSKQRRLRRKAAKKLVA